MSVRRVLMAGAISMAVAALLVGATACSSSGDAVAVVGDSITALDQPALEEDLGDSYRFTVTGNFGKTVAEVLPNAEVVAASKPSQVIVNLGTNDVLQGLPVDTSMTAMRQMIDLFPSARCIHLVNVNEHMVVQDTRTSRAAQAQRFNAALEDLAAGDGRVSIIDWNEVAAGELNDEEPPFSSLTEDSIHPTAAGNTQLNELYATALADCS